MVCAAQSIVQWENVQWETNLIHAKVHTHGACAVVWLETHIYLHIYGTGSCVHP